MKRLLVKHYDSTPWGRFKWTLSLRRHPKTFTGYLRLLWQDFVIHPLFEGGECCQDCGGSYVLWWADDDELWRKANNGSLGGLLCPQCFFDRLDDQGILVRFKPEVVKREIEDAEPEPYMRVTPHVPEKKRAW